MSQVKEIVINQCHGHFGLSRVAFRRLRDLGSTTAINEADYGEPWPDDKRSIREKILGDQFCVNISREDPLLIQVIKELGPVSYGMDAKLKIVKVTEPYEIFEDDGFEAVIQMRRSTVC